MKTETIDVNIKTIRAIERILNDWLFNVVPEDEGVEATLDDFDLVQDTFIAKKEKKKKKEK